MPRAPFDWPAYRKRKRAAAKRKRREDKMLMLGHKPKRKVGLREHTKGRKLVKYKTTG